MIRILCLVSVSIASEAERELHRKLFDPEVYNPRVIQDSWRKANRNDYKNLGDFVSSKCAGYNPTKSISYKQGTLLLIENFQTTEPYANNMYQTQEFRCEGNDTIHIRLDPERGFRTEQCCDKLVIEYEGYRKVISGSEYNLPKHLRSSTFANTHSSWLEMSFSTDGSATKQGFKFDILCRNAENRGNRTESVILTNKDSNEVPWSQEVRCVNPHETVFYKLDIDEISSIDLEIINTVIEKTLNVTFDGTGASLTKFSEWIDTNSPFLHISYKGKVKKTMQSGYGYNDGSYYYNGGSYEYNDGSYGGNGGSYYYNGGSYNYNEEGYYPYRPDRRPGPRPLPYGSYGYNDGSYYHNGGSYGYNGGSYDYNDGSYNYNGGSFDYNDGSYDYNYGSYDYTGHYESIFDYMRYRRSGSNSTTNSTHGNIETLVNTTELTNGTHNVTQLVNETLVDFVNFRIQAKCKIKSTVKNVINQVSKHKWNKQLIAEMAKLSTEETVSNFVSKYKSNKTDSNGVAIPNSRISGQLWATRKFREPECTNDCIEGFVMKSGIRAVFASELRKELCVPYLTTQLTAGKAKQLKTY